MATKLIKKETFVFNKGCFYTCLLLLLVLILKMSNDVRYKTVRKLIEVNAITTFRQIFDHITFTSVARDLKINTSRMRPKVENPELLRYKEIIRISELIEVHAYVIMELIRTQLEQADTQDKRA